MEFSGKLKLPQDAGDGIPVALLLEDIFLELDAEGETLGRWRVDDVGVERLYSNKFRLDLAGEEMVFVADDALGFAYDGLTSIEELSGRLQKKRRWKLFGRSRKPEPPKLPTLDDTPTPEAPPERSFSSWDERPEPAPDDVPVSEAEAFVPEVETVDLRSGDPLGVEETQEPIPEEPAVPDPVEPVEPAGFEPDPTPVREEADDPGSGPVPEEVDGAGSGPVPEEAETQPEEEPASDGPWWRAPTPDEPAEEEKPASVERKQAPIKVERASANGHSRWTDIFKFRSREKVPEHEHDYQQSRTVGGITRRVCAVCGHVSFAGEDVYEGWS